MRKTVITVLLCGILLCLPQSVGARSTLGGIIFLDFYSLSLDAEANGTPEDVSLTRVELPSITRLRGRWTNEDDVEMFIELGLGGGSGSTSLNVRHAFGKWDFSTTGQLLAGHTSSPFSPLFPSQAMGNNARESFNVGKGYGEVSSGRAPQVRYTYKFLNARGAFAIALLDPNRDDEIDDEIGGLKSATLPRIDVGLAYRAYNWRFFPGFFFQERKYDQAGIADDSVTSWGASFGLRGGRGPVVFSGEVNVGENMRNANLSIGQSAAALNGGVFTFVDGAGETRLGDTENMSLWVDLGFRFTRGESQGTVHIVAGHMSSERDDALGAEFESDMLGVSVPIDLPWIAKGFRFRPEVFVYDNDNNGFDGISTKKGTQVLAGIQLQYTF